MTKTRRKSNRRKQTEKARLARQLDQLDAFFKNNKRNNQHNNNNNKLDDTKQMKQQKQTIKSMTKITKDSKVAKAKKRKKDTRDTTRKEKTHVTPTDNHGVAPDSTAAHDSAAIPDVATTDEEKYDPNDLSHIAYVDFNGMRQHEIFKKDLEKIPYFKNLAAAKISIEIEYQNISQNNNNKNNNNNNGTKNKNNKNNSNNNNNNRARAVPAADSLQKNKKPRNNITYIPLFGVSFEYWDLRLLISCIEDHNNKIPKHLALPLEKLDSLIRCGNYLRCNDVINKNNIIEYLLTREEPIDPDSTPSQIYNIKNIKNSLLLEKETENITKHSLLNNILNEYNNNIFKIHKRIQNKSIKKILIYLKKIDCVTETNLFRLFNVKLNIIDNGDEADTGGVGSGGVGGGVGSGGGGVSSSVDKFLLKLWKRFSKQYEYYSNETFLLMLADIINIISHKNDFIKYMTFDEKDDQDQDDDIKDNITKEQYNMIDIIMNDIINDFRNNCVDKGM